ncbi:MAG: hypothetical protein V7647_3537 [Acidobacteriota bacterium]|jgi:hypothetical protein
MSPRRLPSAGQGFARAAVGGGTSRPGGHGRGSAVADLEVLSSADEAEDELARLLDEVRDARERLSRLIAAMKAERAGWQEREQRWERWRSQLPNPPKKPPGRDVH